MLVPVLAEATCPTSMRAKGTTQTISDETTSSSSLVEASTGEKTKSAGLSEEVRLAKQNMLLELSGSSHHHRRYRNARRDRRRRARQEAEAAITAAANGETKESRSRQPNNNHDDKHCNRREKEACGDRANPNRNFGNDDDDDYSYESSCSSGFYHSSGDEFSISIASTSSSDDESAPPFHRIQRNLSKKRATWRQVALRERRDASTLTTIKAAARQARLLQLSRSDKSAADESNIDAALLLRQATPKRTTAATNATEVEETSAVRIQAIYRGFSWRKSYHLLVPRMHRIPGHTQPRRHLRAIEPLPAAPSRRRIERTTSEITMSEFGDSLHTDSLNVSRSNYSLGDFDSSHHPPQQQTNTQSRKLAPIPSTSVMSKNNDDDDDDISLDNPFADSEAPCPPHRSDSNIERPHFVRNHAAARTAWAYRSVSSFFGDSPAKPPERRPSGSLHLMVGDPDPLTLSPEPTKGALNDSLMLSPDHDLVKKTASRGVAALLASIPPNPLESAETLQESLVFAHLAHTSSRWDDSFPEPEEADGSGSHSSSGSQKNSNEKTGGVGGPFAHPAVSSSMPIPRPTRKSSPMISVSSRKAINRPENNKEESPKLPLRRGSGHGPLEKTTHHNAKKTQKSPMALSASSNSSSRSFSSPSLLAPNKTSTSKATMTTTASSSKPHRSLSLTERMSNKSSETSRQSYYDNLGDDNDNQEEEGLKGEYQTTSSSAHQRSPVDDRPSRPEPWETAQGSPQMPKRRISKTIPLAMDDTLHSCEEESHASILAPPINARVGTSALQPPPPPPYDDDSEGEQSHSFDTEDEGSHLGERSELSSLTSVSSFTTTSPCAMGKHHSQNKRKSSYRSPQSQKVVSSPSSPSHGAGMYPQKTCIEASQLAPVSTENYGRTEHQETKDAVGAPGGDGNPPLAPQILPPKSPASGNRKHVDDKLQVRRKKRPQPRQCKQQTTDTTGVGKEETEAGPVASGTKFGVGTSTPHIDRMDFSSPRSVADDIITSGAETT